MILVPDYILMTSSLVSYIHPAMGKPRMGILDVADALILNSLSKPAVAEVKMQPCT